MNPPRRIGGVSSRFGVGILYGSRISFATRLKNGEMATFSQDTSNCSRLYKIPFLRSLLVFRQIILVFFLARRNLVNLARQNLVDLDRRRRIPQGILFLILYIAFITFIEPLLGNLTPLLRWIILPLSLLLLIRLFFYLVLGDQSLKYHGAEHKVINTFLSGDPLVLPAAQHHSRFAFRCGTTLATLFFLLEILIPESVYLFLEHRFGSTAGLLILFFLILGFAYEILTILSRQGTRKWLNLLSFPITKMQLLTTREPSFEELEVALTAIREAVGWQSPLSNDFLGGIFHGNCPPSNYPFSELSKR